MNLNDIFTFKLHKVSEESKKEYLRLLANRHVKKK